jgi:hypothetical protein
MFEKLPTPTGYMLMEVGYARLRMDDYDDPYWMLILMMITDDMEGGFPFTAYYEFSMYFILRPLICI